MKKNQKIINLRALAIILVVFGHSIILYSSEWDTFTTERTCIILDYIKKVINIIQMPLFFSISGYLFYYSYTKRNLIELIIEKFKRLIIPFLLVALLWFIPVRMLLNYSGYQGLNYIEIFVDKVLLGHDMGHLWFLPTLFYMFIIMKIILEILKKAENKVQYYALSFIIFLEGILIYKITKEWSLKYYPYFDSVAIHFIYFYLGFAINKYKIEEKLNSKKIGKILLLTFNIAGIIIYLISPSDALKVAMGVISVISLYITMKEEASKATEILSENSFGVYLLHSPLKYITYTYYNNAEPFFVVTTNFVFWGAIALLMTIGIRKTKFKFILGEK